MAYGNSFIFVFWKLITSDQELAFQIRRCTEIDFGDYGPKGGGTTIAHIRWDLDAERKNIVACRFEGIPEAVHTLTLEKPLPLEGDDRPTDADVERIMAHWKGFTQTIQKRHEVEVFERRREQLRRQEAARL
jgi:hypothetical protein